MIELHYSEALDKQVEILERLSRATDGPSRASMFLDPAVKVTWLLPLQVGDTFYLSPQICDLISSAAGTLPLSWRLLEELVDVRSGFMWLGKELQPPIDWEGEEFFIRALTWTLMYDDEENNVRAIPMPWAEKELDPQKGYRLCITFFTDGIPATGVIARFGESLEEMQSALEESEREEDEDWGMAPATMRYLQFFATTLTFMAQRLLMRSRRPPQRSTRKRAERAEYEPRDVNVIILRKSLYRGHPQEHREVDWNCQWWVRGHWRDQWYPSLQCHQPRWILPYVKGPEDKPLRDAPKRLFAVIR